MATTNKSWTEGRRKSFITSVLRGGYRRWPPKYECLNGAFTEKKINIKTGRVSKHFKCNECQQEFPTSGVNVDHILPIVNPSEGFISWDSFIEGLFCSIDNLQVLCSECHTAKSLIENNKRKKNVSNKKTKKTT